MTDTITTLVMFILFGIILTASGCDGWCSRTGDGYHYFVDGKEHVLYIGPKR